MQSDLDKRHSLGVDGAQLLSGCCVDIFRPTTIGELYERRVVKVVMFHECNVMIGNLYQDSCRTSVKVDVKGYSCYFEHNHSVIPCIIDVL